MTWVKNRAEWISGGASVSEINSSRRTMQAAFLCIRHPGGGFVVSGALMDFVKSQYESHKRSAKGRGIEFNLSFEEWKEVWGDKLHLRGTGPDQLGMLRARDEGGYTKGNVRLGTPKENHQEKAVAYRVKKAQAPAKSSDFAVTAPARGAWLWRNDVFKEYVEEEEYS